MLFLEMVTSQCAAIYQLRQYGKYLEQSTPQVGCSIVVKADSAIASKTVILSSLEILHDFQNVSMKIKVLEV